MAARCASTPMLVDGPRHVVKLLWASDALERQGARHPGDNRSPHTSSHWSPIPGRSERYLTASDARWSGEGEEQKSPLGYFALTCLRAVLAEPKPAEERRAWRDGADSGRGRVLRG